MWNAAEGSFRWSKGCLFKWTGFVSLKSFLNKYEQDSSGYTPCGGEKKKKGRNLLCCVKAQHEPYESYSVNCLYSVKMPETWQFLSFISSVCWLYVQISRSEQEGTQTHTHTHTLTYFSCSDLLTWLHDSLQHLTNTHTHRVRQQSLWSSGVPNGASCKICLLPLPINNSTIIHKV